MVVMLRTLPVHPARTLTSNDRPRLPQHASWVYHQTLERMSPTSVPLLVTWVKPFVFPCNPLVYVLPAFLLESRSFSH